MPPFIQFYKKYCFLILYFLIAIFLSTSDSYTYPWEIPIYGTAGVGDYFTFNSTIDLPPPALKVCDIRWKKDNKTIFEYIGNSTTHNPYDDRINLIDDTDFGFASINLTSINDTDVGWYQCEIFCSTRSSYMRYTNFRFYLNVLGDDIQEIFPLYQIVQEGEVANITCSTKDPDSKIIWKKDGILLQEGQDYTTDNNTLMINTTDKGGFTEYSCEVTKNQTNETARALLNVQYPAKVISVPLRKRLTFGQYAQIICNFDANPPYANVEWRKDGQKIDLFTLPKIPIIENERLYMRKVDYSVEGLYTCTPYNALGTQGPSAPIKVTVKKTYNYVLFGIFNRIRIYGNHVQIRFRLGFW